MNPRWCVFLTVVVVFFGMLVPPAAIAFSDVPSYHPYRVAIDDLYARGVVSGYEDGTFQPKEPVARAQLAKMVCGTLGLQPTEDEPLPPFTDLGPDNPSNLYPHEYVALAFKYGIVKGKSSTAFEPYESVLRAQAVTMVVRGLRNLKPDLLWEGDDPQPLNWSPWGTALSGTDHLYWAGLAAQNYLFYNIDIMGGEIEGGWVEPGVAADPWTPMPREETAQLMYNTLMLR